MGETSLTTENEVTGTGTTRFKTYQVDYPQPPVGRHVIIALVNLKVSLYEVDVYPTGKVLIFTLLITVLATKK